MALSSPGSLQRAYQNTRKEGAALITTHNSWTQPQQILRWKPTRIVVMPQVPTFPWENTASSPPSRRSFSPTVLNAAAGDRVATPSVTWNASPTPSSARKIPSWGPPRGASFFEWTVTWKGVRRMHCWRLFIFGFFILWLSFGIFGRIWVVHAFRIRAVWVVRTGLLTKAKHEP